MSAFDLPQIVDTTAVSQVDYHARLGSTNDRALELIKTNCVAFPLLVLTDEQLAGRGQGDRKWLAGKGSLTFSVCLPDSSLAIPDSQESLLSLTVGLAVCHTIDALTDLRDVQLKWPNDVLIDGKKCCGILIEKVARRAGSVLVIGIGLNVNNEISLTQIANIEALLPNDITVPTSLRGETNYRLDLNRLLIRLINQIFSSMEQLIAVPDTIVTQSCERLILLNQSLQIVLPGGDILTGTCLGVGSCGELLIESSTGQQAIFSGRVRANPAPR